MMPSPSNPAEDASSKILGATMAVTVLAFVTWSARMYVRLIMVRNVGMDVSQRWGVETLVALADTAGDRTTS